MVLKVSSEDKNRCCYMLKAQVMTRTLSTFLLLCLSVSAAFADFTEGSDSSTYLKGVASNDRSKEKDR